MQKTLWVDLLLLIAIIALVNAGSDSFIPSPSRERLQFCISCAFSSLSSPSSCRLETCPSGYEILDPQVSPEGVKFGYCCIESL